MKAIIQQLRLHQWTKNLLIAVPLILSHQFSNNDAVNAVVFSIVAFCLVASGVYTMNDLIDAESDARHPDKCNRPIPSGRLSKRGAVLLLIGLILTGSLVAALYMSETAIQWLCIYVVLNIVYSFWLRGKVILDVLVLGMFYTIRIWLGGASANVPLSPWLLSFSLFLFMSLAFVKRYTELLTLKSGTADIGFGRGYQPNDASFILVLGSSLGFIAILVFVLYLNSPEVGRLYRHPERLWLFVPMIMYWVSYLWLKAHRGEVHGDPVVFMLRDTTSYIVGAASIATFLWAWL